MHHHDFGPKLVSTFIGPLGRGWRHVCVFDSGHHADDASLEPTTIFSGKPRQASLSAAQCQQLSNS